MNRVSLACVRVLFFVMLFISTACNKMDRGISAAVPAAPVAVASADDVRVKELDARVRYLEAELARVNKQESLFSDIPGGVTWD